MDGPFVFSQISFSIAGYWHSVGPTMYIVYGLKPFFLIFRTIWQSVFIVRNVQYFGSKFCNTFQLIYFPANRSWKIWQNLPPKKSPRNVRCSKWTHFSMSKYASTQKSTVTLLQQMQMHRVVHKKSQPSHASNACAMLMPSEPKREGGG